MRLLTLLSLFLCTIMLSAQDRIDFRLSHPATHKDVRYQPSIQATYHISPWPGYLGVLLGTEFTYVRYRDRFISCTNCDRQSSYDSPINFGGRIVNHYYFKSRSKSLAAAFFLRFQWNAQRTRKLRVYPSLDLVASDVLFSKYIHDQYWGFVDGTSYDPPRFREISDLKQVEIGLYLRPELKIDYLIIPDWQMRIGAMLWRNLFITGDNNLQEERQMVGIYLSKTIKG